MIDAQCIQLWNMFLRAIKPVDILNEIFLLESTDKLTNFSQKKADDAIMTLVQVFIIGEVELLNIGDSSGSDADIWAA